MTPASEGTRTCPRLDASGCHRCGAREAPEMTAFPGGAVARCRVCGNHWTRESGPECATCGQRDVVERLSTPERPLYHVWHGCRVVSLCTTCDAQFLEPKPHPDGTTAAAEPTQRLRNAQASTLPKRR
jgi:hypothetical protein